MFLLPSFHQLQNKNNIIQVVQLDISSTNQTLKSLFIVELRISWSSKTHNSSCRQQLVGTKEFVETSWRWWGQEVIRSEQEKQKWLNNYLYVQCSLLSYLSYITNVDFSLSLSYKHKHTHTHFFGSVFLSLFIFFSCTTACAKLVHDFQAAEANKSLDTFRSSLKKLLWIFFHHSDVKCEKNRSSCSLAKWSAVFFPSISNHQIYKFQLDSLRSYLLEKQLDCFPIMCLRSPLFLYIYFSNIPECVEDATITPDPQHAIRCGDPVGVCLFGIAEEGVRDPDLSHHVAVETQHLHGAVKLEASVVPSLGKKYVNGVFLQGATQSSLSRHGLIKVEDFNSLYQLRN